MLWGQWNVFYKPYWDPLRLFEFSVLLLLRDHLHQWDSMAHFIPIASSLTFVLRLLTDKLISVHCNWVFVKTPATSKLGLAQSIKIPVSKKWHLDHSIFVAVSKNINMKLFSLSSSWTMKFAFPIICHSKWFTIALSDLRSGPKLSFIW